MSVVGYLAKGWTRNFEGATFHPLAEKLARRAESNKFVKQGFQTLPDGRRTLDVIQSPVAAMMGFVARALYYHEHAYTRRWPGECQILDSNFLPYSPAPGVDAAGFLAGGFDELRRRRHPGFDLKGAHPDVFGYQLYEWSFGKVVLEMRFYGILTFYAIGDHPTP